MTRFTPQPAVPSLSVSRNSMISNDLSNLSNLCPTSSNLEIACNSLISDEMPNLSNLK
jgi:hypothetical protein